MKVSVYIATSLDGYIARKDDDIEWLTSFPSDSSEDYGYSEFMSSIDCIVMGRNTYKKVSSFSEWPYKKPVIVISKTLKNVPIGHLDKVTIFSNEISDLMNIFLHKKYNRIYVDGGKTIQSFLNAGYITDMILTQIPILLGSGICLFGNLNQDIYLKHIETKSYSSGFVQTKYEIIRNYFSPF